MIRPLALALTAAILVVCFGSCKRPLEKRLVGTWETYFGTAASGMARAVVTYSKDGAVVAEVHAATIGTTRGQWRIEGGEIVTRVTTSTLRKANEGKEFRETIVRLEDDALVVKDADEKILSYKRVQ